MLKLEGRDMAGRLSGSDGYCEYSMHFSKILETIFLLEESHT
jgi:hypothetical protein